MLSLFYTNGQELDVELLSKAMVDDEQMSDDQLIANLYSNMALVISNTSTGFRIPP
jgi:hypothetical protein